MLMTKREEVTMQGFCKYSEENSALGEASYYNCSLGEVEVSAYLSFDWEEERVCAYLRLGPY